jgi:hypothetical protein
MLRALNVVIDKIGAQQASLYEILDGVISHAAVVHCSIGSIVSL